MAPESKQQRFTRLASYRTNEVLKRLKVLGNCSNRQAYDYTEEDIHKIFTEIEKTTKGIRAKFYYPTRNKTFKL